MSQTQMSPMQALEVLDRATSEISATRAQHQAVGAALQTIFTALKEWETLKGAQETSVKPASEEI